MKPYADLAFSKHADSDEVSAPACRLTPVYRNTHSAFRTAHLLWAVLLLGLSVTHCFGVSSTFYGTGVLGYNADPNYKAVFPIGPSLALFEVDLPPSNWVAPPPGTNWVNQFGTADEYHFGSFDYQTTFNWSGGDLSGVFAADNRATIFLDNVNTGIHTLGPNGFDHLTPFDLGVLTAGQHVVDFILTNDPGDSGVFGLVVAPTPEPTSLLLFGSTVLGLGGLLRHSPRIFG
jgi:hypothetical protein